MKWSALLVTLSLSSIASPQHDATTFQKSVPQLLGSHCTLCHNAKIKTGNLNLEALRDPAAAMAERDVWETVLGKLKSGQMPPPGRPALSLREKQQAVTWIEAHLNFLDRNRKPDPGRVTARRLNRSEYNNTIRDLLGVDFRPADDFPADDAGYGFDNIGDVLSLSPVLMEKYLAAAQKVASTAIVADPILKPTLERYEAERVRNTGAIPTDSEGAPLSPTGAIQLKHRFPVEAEYEVQVGMGGRRPPDQPALQVALLIDGRQAKLYRIDPNPNAPRRFTVRVPVAAGEHELTAAFLKDDSRPEDAARDKNVVVDYLEVRGPFDQKPRPLTDPHKRIFTCAHSAGAHTPDCARTILTPLARRAWRRPVASAEVDGLSRFLDLAQKEGDTFEQGVQLALQAILVSPHFLFRIERHPAPTDPTANRQISDFELASRLSYFLWSSMPDETLFTLAEQSGLRKPGVLAAQVRRLLLDPKAEAFTENFAGQWLHLRNLESVKPDPDRFPGFDDKLRQAMHQETKMFFETVVREDRSILDFLDGRFTFLNERLARHYGIPGIEGEQFRRVTLDGEQRGGILTHASILTVTSYPTRTSPVVRGLWVLENFLAAPPPPPPPDVPQLKEEEIGATMSLRTQLEKHRADPNCAVCHVKMDALGFGLENYDAIGQWRTHDGKFPVDAAGRLPDGKSFSKPSQLRQILKSDRDSFARCVTEKVLTYALGRGLERYDGPVVAAISRKLAGNNHRFSTLVLEVVNSMPFQMRRGEAPKSQTAARK